MNFQLSAQSEAEFAHLFDLSDVELAAQSLPPDRRGEAGNTLPREPAGCRHRRDRHPGEL